MHVLLPALLAVPALQILHEMLPDGENSPSAQFEQALALLTYVPAAQVVQKPATPSLTLPLAQGVQTLTPPME